MAARDERELRDPAGKSPHPRWRGGKVPIPTRNLRRDPALGDPKPLPSGRAASPAGNSSQTIPKGKDPAGPRSRDSGFHHSDQGQRLRAWEAFAGKGGKKGNFSVEKNMEKGLGELWSGAGSPKTPVGGIWDLLEEGEGNDMEKLGGGFPGVSPSPRNIPESKTAFPNPGGNPQIRERIPKSQSSSPNPEHLPRFHNPIPKSIPSSLPVRGPAPGPDPGVPGAGSRRSRRTC